MVVGKYDNCYENKLAKMTREQLIERIQNQRIEIKNLLKSHGMYVHMVVWRSQIIRSAIKYLKEKRPACALGVLRDRVTDGDVILKELANG